MENTDIQDISTLLKIHIHLLWWWSSCSSFKFQTLLSQTREKQASTLSEVTWQKRTVPVKSEPVRLFLLNLQESGEEVEKAEGLDNKISIYESILKQCIDAQQVLRDSLQEDQVGITLVMKVLFPKCFYIIFTNPGLLRYTELTIAPYWQG